MYLAAGWTIAAFGIMQLPIWAAVAIIKQEGNSWSEKIRGAFRPTADWGPRDPAIFEQYQKLRATNEENDAVFQNANIFVRFKKHIFG